MNKLLIGLVLFMFVAGGTFTVISAQDTPKRELVVCTCGCKMKAVKCTCPTAVEILKEFDKKHKGA